MINSMRLVEGSAAAPVVLPQSETARQLYATLKNCLTQLDAMDAHLAAAHLSACVDVLHQSFNPD